MGQEPSRRMRINQPRFSLPKSCHERARLLQSGCPWPGAGRAHEALRDGCINGQDAAGEGGQNVASEPSPENSALWWVAALGQQHAHFQFLLGDGRQRKTGDHISIISTVSMGAKR